MNSNSAPTSPTPIKPAKHNFRRDVWCLFGLPVDNLAMDQTMDLVYEWAQNQGSAVLSTININWVAQSLRDPSFRAAILNSDFVIVDGKPLLWLSKLLGLPLRETVPGSTLIQELKQNNAKRKPLSLFLFGGEGESARQAQKKVNYECCGLSAVGALNPGYGSVAEMSSELIIDRINECRADILLVALGAGKGTQWIESNRHRLNAKVVSHLGATINFLAGTVRRAPKMVNRIGLEWVWRIFQEPKLFWRYFKDGLLILKWLDVHFFLLLQYRWMKARFQAQVDTGKTLKRENEQEIHLHFGRCLRIVENSPTKELLHECTASGKNIVLDFQQTRFADSSFIGNLLVLMKHQHRQNKSISITGISRSLNRIFRLFCIPESMHALGFEIREMLAEEQEDREVSELQIDSNISYF